MRKRLSFRSDADACLLLLLVQLIFFVHIIFRIVLFIKCYVVDVVVVEEATLFLLLSFSLM